MGFTPEDTEYNLVFEDPHLKGLEVKVREISTGELMDLVENLDSANNAQVIRMLADGLVSWNVTDKKGKRVPADLDGVRRQPFKLVMSVVNAWVQAMAAVDENLVSGSSTGGTSLEQSLPMAL